jgi:4-amino-4-deoxy-L-arabinose transferase-like glycosyltransferase
VSDSPEGTPQDYRPVIVLTITFIAYVALAFGYITRTPIWQNPDEPAHYNYIGFVAETGGLPELRAGDWDSALLDRLKNGTLRPADSVGSIQYEAWQPPLFYLAAAPVYRVGPRTDAGAVVFRLRAFDAALGAVTLGIAYFVAREVLQSHLAVFTPAVIAGMPMFTAVSAAISVDPLTNLLAAATLLPLVRRLHRSVGGFGWPVASGVLIGLAVLTKLAAAIFVPLALAVIVVRSRRPRREAAVLLATIALVVAPWLVHQVTTYGWTDPLALGRHASVVQDQPRFPGLSAEYLDDFLTTTFHSFWAQFGWMAIVAPTRLYWAWALLTFAAMVGLVRERRRLAEPSGRLLVSVVITAIIAYIGYNFSFQQFQGRYLFTALTPIAVLLTAGWAAWLPARAAPWGLALIAALLLALNVYTLLRVLVPGFAPAG